MNLQEIKRAVRTGKTVHWCNEEYEVRIPRNVWWIVHVPTGRRIRLTWSDNKTLLADESDFYVKQTEEERLRAMLENVSMVLSKVAVNLHDVFKTRGELRHAALTQVVTLDDAVRACLRGHAVQLTA